jgi:hypothetical protein
MTDGNTDTSLQSTYKSIRDDGSVEENENSRSPDDSGDSGFDKFMLKLGRSDLLKTCADISSFRGLESKDSMDSMSDGLIRIRARMNRGEALNQKEKGFLVDAGLSSECNAEAVTRRAQQCVSVDESIRKFGAEILRNLNSELESFNRLSGNDASRLKRQLEKNLYRGLKEIGDSGIQIDNVDVIDVIRYGQARPDMTRRELSNSLEDLSSLAISRGSDTDSVFRALREFNRKNSWGMSFRKN